MKKKKKFYEVHGNIRFLNDKWETLYLRTYNRNLAIQYAEKHKKAGYFIFEFAHCYYIQLY